jgi:hypothetical protein
MKTLEERFWSYVAKGNEEECWEWRGALKKNGYGVLTVNHRQVLVHRLSYELHNGDIGDLCVCHSCDNPKCVNPNHLFLGTHQENMDDKVEKGRVSRGEDLPQTKLTVEDVLFIRESAESLRALSKRFGVSYQAISLIRNRKTWNHV